MDAKRLSKMTGSLGKPSTTMRFVDLQHAVDGELPHAESRVSKKHS